jgi:hypothetical protein
MDLPENGRNEQSMVGYGMLDLQKYKTLHAFLNVPLNPSLCKILKTLTNPFVIYGVLPPTGRGGHMQLFLESAIAIPQLEGSTSAIAIPQLLKNVAPQWQLRNCNFSEVPNLRAWSS